MPTLTEGRHTGEFILSEGDDSISRDQVILSSAAPALAAGTLLGKITASGKHVAYVDGAADGSQTAVGILYMPAADLAVDQKVTIVSRLCEVKRAELTGLDANGEVDLAAKFIIIR